MTTRRAVKGQGSFFERRMVDKRTGKTYRRWVAVITTSRKGEPRKRATLYGRTLDELQAKVAERKRDMAGGVKTLEGRVTFARYVEEWLADVESEIGPRTFRSYRELLRHATEILGSTALRDVTGYHLDRLRDKKLAAGLSPQSVSLVRAAVRRCPNDAVRRNLIASNPVGDSKKPLVMRHKVEPMPPERARAILDAVRDDPYAPIYALAIGTGLRRGELLGLRSGDVDLAARSITVRQALRNLRGDEPTFAKPKTRDSEARVVDLPPFAVDALREQRTRQLEARLLVGPA